MDNRSEFLNNVAQALGRPLRLEPQAEDAPLNNYANERLTQLTQQQRCDAFIQFASDVMLTRCELTSEAKAAEAAIRLCKELGDQSVVISGDTRLEELGISETFAAGMQCRCLGSGERCREYLTGRAG